MLRREKKNRTQPEGSVRTEKKNNDKSQIMSYKNNQRTTKKKKKKSVNTIEKMTLEGREAEHSTILEVCQ